jgi:hypothetical protein
MTEEKEERTLEDVRHRVGLVKYHGAVFQTCVEDREWLLALVDGLMVELDDATYWRKRHCSDSFHRGITSARNWLAARTWKALAKKLWHTTTPRGSQGRASAAIDIRMKNYERQIKR